MQTELSERILDYAVRIIKVVESLRHERAVFAFCLLLFAF